MMEACCSIHCDRQLIFLHVLQEFLMSQGRNAKVSAEFKGSLSDILADLAVSMEHKQVTPRSTMAADLVTVGDSWLATAVQGGLIEPIRNAEQFDWFNRLHPRWQVWQSSVPFLYYCPLLYCCAYIFTLTSLSVLYAVLFKYLSS